MARQRAQAGPADLAGRQGNLGNTQGENEMSKSEDADAAAGQASSMDVPPSRPQLGGKKGGTGAAIEWLLMVVLMLYICYLVNVYQSDKLPVPLSHDQAGPRGFSEISAREHISSLVEFGPHPVGTEALDKALMYVYSQLMEIKEIADGYVDFEVDLFEPSPGLERLAGGLFYGKSLVYANLRHLVVRISPSDSFESKETAILMSTHIDTVVTSPGAGDCSSCVAVMLELVRSLSYWARGFKHSIIFLFNTGEEEGLIGAHSFITQHPWSSTIRAAIDVESMGVGGRSTLFQAGSDKWLLQQYASVAKYPAAQIGAQDVFHSGLVKSATDFQVYREVGGLSGLDFGFVENGAVYHTKNDKIEFLRAGSLQHIGEDLLALLQKVALSDELEFQRTNSSGSEKMEMVYFDILGKWMVTYPQSTAKTQYANLITQGLVLLFSSLYLSGYSAFLEFGLALLSVAFTWIFAMVCVMVVATVIPFMSSFAVPYIAHPWLAVGLFGAPAVFGALIGHALGRLILMHFLEKKHIEEHAGWHAERWLFKAGIFQWVLFLALGTWAEAGSSYVTLFWIVPPTITYAMFEAQFSPRQTLRGLQRTTLWLSTLPGVAMSAVSIIRLTSAIIGMLVRFERDPGGRSEWIGNAFTGIMIASFACLLLSYLLPYAHRSGGLVHILLALTAVFVSASLLVMTQLVPAFTEDTGRGIQAVHVIDTTTGHGGPSDNPHSYMSLFSVTPGKLDKEMSILNDKEFICGQSHVDFVSFTVKYGCMKRVDADEDLSGGQPTLHIEKDYFVGDQRVTLVRFSSGAARRWNMAINTTAIKVFKMKTVIATGGEGKLLVPGGAIVGVDGWHNVQYVTDAEGPSDFQLYLLWHASSQEETSLNSRLETLLLKVRTDVNVITDELGDVLDKLPSWCVLFGKSTAPYSLTYLADLKANRILS